MISIDSLLHFLKCQFLLYQIPFRVYKNKKPLAKFENGNLARWDEAREAGILDQFIFNENEGNIKFDLKYSLMIEGAIYNRREDLLIYVGTARLAKVTEPVLRRFLKWSGEYVLQDETIKKLLIYINGMPIIPPVLFLTVLSEINAIVNDEIIPVDSLAEYAVKDDTRENTVRTELLKQRDEIYFDETRNINSHEIEDRFMFLIRNGMVKQLKDYCNSIGIFLIAGNTSNPDMWRTAKNRIIVSTAFASSTAISAGVSPLEAQQLADAYIQKVELCHSDKTLNELRYNMLVDFAERVSVLSISTVENFTVKRIVDYILDNLDKPINLKETSEKFKISKNYLCTIFKEETGMSLTDFVNTNKINVAKELLRYTDKSIVDIANYLSFCSQSYFQQVFKKFTRVTPIEFRNSTEEL